MTVPANEQQPKPNLLYEQRKVEGLCTRCGKAAVEDGQLCAKHLKKLRAADRRSVAKRRAARRAAGYCATCPKKKKRKSKTYRCATCMTKWMAANASVVSSVDRFDEKQDRIRARTAVEADGRTRYRGQTRRGRQTVGDLDEQDLDQLALYVAKAKAGLAYARRPEAADVPRIQRKEAEHAALGELAMGLRFGFDVCKRNRFDVPEPVDDEGDE